MRFFKFKYKDDRLSTRYYSFYFQGKKIQKRTIFSPRSNVSRDKHNRRVPWPAQ
jgi:hypothetical protein